MYAVVRRYTGAGDLADALTKNRQDVERIIGGVAGFVAYYATRDGDRVTTVTVCNDKAGTEQSTQRAAQWVKDNLPGATFSAPEVSSGETFIQFTK